MELTHSAGDRHAANQKNLLYWVVKQKKRKRKISQESGWEDDCEVVRTLFREELSEELHCNRVSSVAILGEAM